MHIIGGYIHCSSLIKLLKNTLCNWVKQKLNFSQKFQWQDIPRRKTNKSYDTTAVQNDPGYKTK